ncbi:FRG domain-containing protein [Vibrio parahaemolyticus]|nr:FRG domain-containing protein [Vibrio parahaemolyticus]EHK2856306.1 FRG domain-containing protein [Vibrio parahaemolyticus]
MTRETVVSSLAEYVDYIESLDGLDDLWFRGVSNSVFKPLPGLIWKGGCDLSTEATIEHRFLVSFKSYVDNTSLTEWEVFTLMQHHGLPTRMLDWSESALVALYFALSSDLESEEYGAVWCLSPYELNQRTIGIDRVYCPAEMRNKIVGELNLDAYLPPNLQPSYLALPQSPIAINANQHIKRVSSQKGCFTVHGSDQRGIDQFMEGSESFRLIKIDARGHKARTEMLAKLSKLGIDEEFIYQDLDSLCKRITREVLG